MLQLYNGEPQTALGVRIGEDGQGQLVMRRDLPRQVVSTGHDTERYGGYVLMLSVYPNGSPVDEVPSCVYSA